MNRILFILLVVLTNSVNAQSNLEVRVLANNEVIELGKSFMISNKTYRIDLIKFYITNLKFLSHGKVVADLSNSPNLINFEDDSTRFIQLTNVPNFDEIKFTFGVDSTTNVNGVMSGALDPVNGMYWTWQSGYINCKIEGEIIDQNTKPIEYHLGGYLPDQLAAREVVLPVNSNDSLVLEFHLERILSSLSDEHLFQIMSPGESAVFASGLLSETFKFSKK